MRRFQVCRTMGSFQLCQFSASVGMPAGLHHVFLVHRGTSVLIHLYTVVGAAVASSGQGSSARRTGHRPCLGRGQCGRCSMPRQLPHGQRALLWLLCKFFLSQCSHIVHGDIVQRKGVLTVGCTLVGGAVQSQLCFQAPQRAPKPWVKHEAAGIVCCQLCSSLPHKCHMAFMHPSTHAVLCGQVHILCRTPPRCSVSASNAPRSPVAVQGVPQCRKNTVRVLRI